VFKDGKEDQCNSYNYSFLLNSWWSPSKVVVIDRDESYIIKKGGVQGYSSASQSLKPSGS